MINPYIVSSIITAAATTFVGTLSWYNAREARHHAEATRTIVTGNGKGDVAHMMESLLEWQERHEIKDDKRFKKMNRQLRKVSVDSEARSDSHRDPGHASAAGRTD